MNSIKIYTDGSFINGKCGFGAVILNDGGIIHEIFGSVTEESMLAHRQVAGEIAAVFESLEWCIKNNINKVQIFYDYEGVASWAAGKWKTNTELTSRYANYFKKCPVSVSWIKVKAHSGDQWNDYVDKLAKTGAQGKSGTTTNVKVKTDVGHEKVSIAFYEFLLDEGLNVIHCGIINNCFSRIEIRDPDKRGVIDIYSKKDGPKIDLRAFKEIAEQAKIEEFWVYFLKNYSSK